MVAGKAQRAAASKRGDGAADGVYHVMPGDTFWSIASRFGVSVSDLAASNPDVDPRRLQLGQRIGLPVVRKTIQYTIERGDMLSTIADAHHVTLASLRAANPRVDPRRLRVGETLVIESESVVSRSQSIGLPNDGQLAHAVQLRPGPLYTIRDPNRSYGTLETVQAIRRGFAAVRRRFGPKSKVCVHDLSARDGGQLQQHLSHQSGRDVDIGYFQKRYVGRVSPFQRIRPQDLEVRRQWTLMHTWLANDRVEYIFMAYALQRPLYLYAKRHGATRQQLRQWFQYPRGKHDRVGVIRDYPHHDTHIHVRFKCPDGDAHCGG